jgi:hypothetical protein
MLVTVRAPELLNAMQVMPDGARGALKQVITPRQLQCTSHRNHQAIEAQREAAAWGGALVQPHLGSESAPRECGTIELPPSSEVLRTSKGRPCLQCVVTDERWIPNNRAQ